MQIAYCYIFPPWCREGHIILRGAWSNDIYLCCTVNTVWILVFHPLLQREPYSWIIICHGQTNLYHRTAHASLKVGVGTWIGTSSQIRDQRTGVFRLWMDSKYHCGCIWHDPLILTCDSSTCSFPNRITSPYQSRCNAPVQWKYFFPRRYCPPCPKPRNFPLKLLLPTQ